MKIKWFSNFTMAFVLLLSSVRFPSGSITNVSQTHTLYVDTPLDSNMPEYQACTDAPLDCTLRGAISRSNADLNETYFINIPAYAIGISIPGSDEDFNNSGDLDIYGSIYLLGQSTYIHGNGIDRVLHIHPGAHVEVGSLIVMGGKTPDALVGAEDADPGGGIYNAGYLVMNGCVVQGNTTGEGGADGSVYYGGNGGNGGGIFNSGYLQLWGTIIKENSTGKGGGKYLVFHSGNGGHGAGIFNTGTLAINGGIISDNITGSGGDPEHFWASEKGSGGSGGGIYNTGFITIEDITVVSNHVGGGSSMFFSGYMSEGGKGGGIFNSGHLNLFHGSVVQNSSAEPGGSGGGIYSTGRLEIEDVEIKENTSGYRTGHGGGLFLSDSSVSWIRESIIQGNQTGDGYPGFESKAHYEYGGAGGSGGGIYSAGVLHVINSNIMSNLTGNGGSGFGAGGDGSGIYNSGDLEIINTQVLNNIAGYGGGSEYSSLYTWEIIPGGNGGRGGGIFNLGSLLMTLSKVAENRTGDGGGECTQNTPAGEGGSGGGIYNSGNMILAHSTVVTNTTGLGGAGCFPSGAGGSGGGFYNAGSMEVSYSAILSNNTGSGGIGGDAVDDDGDGGSGGDGGGGFNTGSLNLQGVIIKDNLTGEGGLPGSGSIPGKPGLDGSGGGLFIADSPEVNIESTLTAQNRIAEFGIGSGLLISGTVVPLVHNTLVRNMGGDGSGIHAINAQLYLTNTLIVSHTVGITAAIGSVINLDTTFWGEGNWTNGIDWGGLGVVINQNDLIGDPGFVAPEADNYHINPDSAAIDQGVLTPSTADVDDQPIPNPDTGLPDIGADEYWLSIPLNNLSINSPATIEAYTPFTVTAQISPTNATPNIYFHWYPEPERGQFTDTAEYIFQNSDRIHDKVSISLSVTNVGGTLVTVKDFWFEFVDLKVFLPLINR